MHDSQALPSRPTCRQDQTCPRCKLISGSRVEHVTSTSTVMRLEARETRVLGNRASLLLCRCKRRHTTCVSHLGIRRMPRLFLSLYVQKRNSDFLVHCILCPAEVVPKSNENDCIVTPTAGKPLYSRPKNLMRTSTHSPPSFRPKKPAAFMATCKRILETSVD